MVISDVVISLIRTFVPLVVGGFVTWAIRQGWLADNSVAQPLTEALVVVVSGVYYALVRVLEHWWAGFGWLLGAARKPAYGTSPAAAGNMPRTGQRA